MADMDPNAAVVDADEDDEDDADDDEDEDGAPAAAVVDEAAADEPGGEGMGAGAYCIQPELVDEDGDAGGEPWLDDGRWW